MKRISLKKGRQPVAIQPQPGPPPQTTAIGLPAMLQAGVEQLSGHSLDGVRVHFNSARPAQLQALAYAQGSEIQPAPGQQAHLSHEAWHVVQQQQGRVRPEQPAATPLDDAGAV